jgi:hypothetical protein
MIERGIDRELLLSRSGDGIRRGSVGRPRLSLRFRWRRLRLLWRSLLRWRVRLFSPRRLSFRRLSFRRLSLMGLLGRHQPEFPVEKRRRNQNHAHENEGDHHPRFIGQFFRRFFFFSVGEFHSLSATPRHGVKAALVEGMAAAKPLQTEPDSVRRPVKLNRLAHVFRTRRIKAAGRGKQGGNHAFVDGEESDESRLQRTKRRRTSACRSVNVQSRVLRRGLNTIDHSEFRESSSSRTASRMRRRIRFRATALPNALGVVKPTRGHGVVSPSPRRSTRQKAAKKGEVKRVPVS